MGQTKMGLQIISLFIRSPVFLYSFHLFQYLHKSKYHTDRLLLVGLLLIMVCVTIESASVYFVTSVSGIFTGIGMIILLFVNVVRTVRGIQHMEDMRQQQELERKQKQTEEMTLQMMRTLAATIEGKDRNNCGHSIRVAEYAALIGKRLGLSSEEIENLKDCAYLHDIGRVNYVTATDEEAVDAFFKLSRYEGIIPALESSHAIAYAMKWARENRGGAILVNCSGRGDKDVDYVVEHYGYGEDRQFPS